MSEPTMQATIVADSRRALGIKLCPAECGIDWSAAGAIALAKQSIRARFGDRAQLEYIELTKATDSQRMRELKPRIQDLPLPLLLMNGHPRISGEFDIRRLLDAIEAEMEMES